MILIAEISSWVGLALLSLSICAAIGALLALPFITLSARGARQAIQSLPTPKSTNLDDALMGFSLAGCPVFLVATVGAALNALPTSYEMYDLKIYLMLCALPAVCAVWLGVLIYALFRHVPKALLAALLIIAALTGALALNVEHHYPG
jgi:hypothetical protein